MCLFVIMFKIGFNFFGIRNFVGLIWHPIYTHIVVWVATSSRITLSVPHLNLVIFMFNSWFHRRGDIHDVLHSYKYVLFFVYFIAINPQEPSIFWFINESVFFNLFFLNP